MQGKVTFIRDQGEQASGFIQRGRYKYSFRAQDVVSGLSRLGLGVEVEFKSLPIRNPYVSARAVSVMVLPLEPTSSHSGLATLALEVK